VLFISLVQSQASAKEGNLKLARNLGLGAAYLSVAAIVSSLALGLFLTALIIPLAASIGE